MPLVTRGDGVVIPTENQGLISTSIDIFDQEGLNIGFLQQNTRNDNRPTTRIRHLDRLDAGRVVEQMPSPEEVGLSINGMALYDVGAIRKSIFQRIAGVSGNAFRSLNSQFIPFNVREEWVHPSNPAQKGRTLYLGNWLNTFTRPINIGTAQVAETATTSVSWVE